jgi:hypothetical protein
MPNYTEKYTNINDRSGWSHGPWDQEPLDKAVWVDPDTGFDCMIKRNGTGAWCGYVGVSSNHSAFEVEYYDVNVTAHGDLTYSNHCAGDICHLHDGDEDETWWLGFDCCHSFDRSPLAFGSFNHGTYRTQQYVIDQVEQLAQSLKNYVHVEAEDCW